MGGLYLTGAFLYAARIPERWLPGKCDIWFQSHQLFHVLVVAAAFVHYHGISEMAMRRLKDLGPQCPTLSVTLDSENLVNIVQKKNCDKIFALLKEFLGNQQSFFRDLFIAALFLEFMRVFGPAPTIIKISVDFYEIF